MKRLIVCGVASCLALGTFAVANAAKGKSTTQSLRIPSQTVATTVSKRTRIKSTLSIAQFPTQELTPIPEAPDSPIFAPPIPGDPLEGPIGYVPPSPVYRPVSPQPVPPIVQLPIEMDYHPITEAPGIEMFKRVRYTGERRKAPNAITKVVVIKDPCQRKNSSCESCVAIEICVPACACEKVTANKSGNNIRYNYGKYGVEIRIKAGRVVVAYHRRGLP